MLTGLVLLAIAVLRGFPETAAARWLQRSVVAPLGTISRTHVIFLILMSVILIAGTELLAMAGPFDMALVLVWDVSAYIDIALTTVVIAGAARSRSGWRLVAQRVLSAIVRRGRRARRSRTGRKLLPPANDDEDQRSISVAA